MRSAQGTVRFDPWAASSKRESPVTRRVVYMYFYTSDSYPAVTYALQGGVNFSCLPACCLSATGRLILAGVRTLSLLIVWVVELEIVFEVFRYLENAASTAIKV